MSRRSSLAKLPHSRALFAGGKRAPAVSRKAYYRSDVLRKIAETQGERPDTTAAGIGIGVFL